MGFAAFLNTSIIFTERLEWKRELKKLTIPDPETPITARIMNLGNWLLAPVRYFGNGFAVEIKRQIMISSYDAQRNPIKTPRFNIEYFQEYQSKSVVSYGNKAEHLLIKNWQRTALFILLFIPGLILGAIVKGISLCFKNIRTSHNLALRHLAPIEIILHGPIDRQATEKDLETSMYNPDGTVNFSAVSPVKEEINKQMWQHGPYSPPSDPSSQHNCLFHPPIKKVTYIAPQEASFDVEGLKQESDSFPLIPKLQRLHNCQFIITDKEPAAASA